MTGLLTATRSAESYRAEPLSIAEIDTHQDSARIWATIAEIQSAVESIVADDVESAAEHHEKEIEQAEQDGADAVWDDISALLLRYSEGVIQDLASALEEMIP